MDIAVRPAERTDLESLVALAREARGSVAGERGGAAMLAELALDVEPSEELAARLDDPEAMVWCAEIDGVPVGYLVAVLDDVAGTRVVVLREVWVDPDAREVGGGEALVSAALAWAIAEDADAIDAYALPEARATKNLFERLGLTARLLTVRRSLR